MSNFLVGRNLADPSYDVFSGTGAQTAFTLTTTSSTAAATVTISGVTQRPGTDFTISGTTLTFTTAPASGTNNVLVQYNKAYVVGTPGDATVTTAKLDDDAVTLAKMAAGTAGNLITYDASGDPAAVATGTATHVLTSNGAGAAPTFQAAGGGVTILVDSAVSTVSTVTFDGYFDDTTYYKYEFIIKDITGAASDRDYRWEFKVGGTWQTSNYIWESFRGYSTMAAAQSSSAAYMEIGRMRGNGSHGRFIMTAAESTGTYKTIYGFTQWNDSPNIYTGTGSGSYIGGTGAVQGARFNLSSGSFSGQTMLIGYKR